LSFNSLKINGLRFILVGSVLFLTKILLTSNIVYNFILNVNSEVCRTSLFSTA